MMINDDVMMIILHNPYPFWESRAVSSESGQKWVMRTRRKPGFIAQKMSHWDQSLYDSLGSAKKCLLLLAWPKMEISWGVLPKHKYKYPMQKETPKSHMFDPALASSRTSLNRAWQKEQTVHFQTA